MLAPVTATNGDPFLRHSVYCSPRRWLAEDDVANDARSAWLQTQVTSHVAYCIISIYTL